MSNGGKVKATGEILRKIRSLMVDKEYVQKPIQAYIVPSNDAHNSEFVSPSEERKGFISGFTGSAGTCVITENKACLWTDGRYFVQAQNQLDQNWTLMKVGLPKVPKMGEWLNKLLPKNSRIGVDPKLLSHSRWNSLQKEINASNHELIPVDKNLIDAVWENKPRRIHNPIVPHTINYTGKSVKDKLKEIRREMQANNASLLVVTALDEIAWLLNLRGSDILYNPLFYAYLFVGEKNFTVFLDECQINDKVKPHLNVESKKERYSIEPYHRVICGLKETTSKLNGSVWCSESTSYAITREVPPEKRFLRASPAYLMKLVKTPSEIEGMKKAHFKDGAALCCFFCWLEYNVRNGTVTEWKALEKIEEFRKMQEDYVGPSFRTISSVGPHGAIIHYSPDPATQTLLTQHHLYLCDTGAQFKDGTTDVTRTVHFGNPTNHEKECYTRVLKGQIALATAVFPAKTKGARLDSFARRHLWDVGLDFRHSTGHGVGCYLNVHEGPISIGSKGYPDDPGLDVGMFVSNEPGYYEEGKFGIRIEDVLLVVPSTTRYNFESQPYLTFQTITMVPKQIKMIAYEMLTVDEINWVNDYHIKCRHLVGPFLDKVGQPQVKEWLYKQTDPLPYK